MSTSTKSDRLVRALTKLVYFYWEWVRLNTLDQRINGRTRKVTELAYAKFMGFAEALAVIHGLSTPARVELDLADFYRANEPPSVNFTSSKFSAQRDAWVDECIAHLIHIWNLMEEES